MDTETIKTQLVEIAALIKAALQHPQPEYIYVITETYFDSEILRGVYKTKELAAEAIEYMHKYDPFPRNYNINERYLLSTLVLR